MTANTLEERKQYINQVRDSFQNPNNSIYYRDIGEASSQEKINSRSVFKWRLGIAVMLFTAFVYCDVNQIKYKSYTTEYVGDLIEKNISIEKIIKIKGEFYDKTSIIG